MTINDNDNDCEKKKKIPRNRFALLKETVKKSRFFYDSTVSLYDTLAACSGLPTLHYLIFPRVGNTAQTLCPMQQYHYYWVV